MKNYLPIILIVFLIGCGESPKQAGSDPEMQAKVSPKVSSSKISLTLDDKTYVYDNLDKEKSRIKYDEDIRLSLRQENLPIIKFRFPDVEKSLAMQQVFRIPDIKRPGVTGIHSPITVNFIVPTGEGKAREAVTVRQGELQASLENGLLMVKFSGEGGPAMDNTIVYSISGSIHLQL